MAKKKTAAIPAPEGTQAHGVAERDLRNKIEWIDAQVRGATDSIRALAAGAEAVLSSGGNALTIYHMLIDIMYWADTLANNVAYEAEEVGANHRSNNAAAEARIIRGWRYNAESVEAA
jgi:hypothetical protein